MFPVDVDDDDPVIMPAKEEHRCDYGSECLDKHEPRDILHCHVERSAQNVAVKETIKEQ